MVERNKKVKIVVLYQVVMHYRLPFYERIAGDELFDFTLIHGRGKKGTKLQNVDYRDSNINAIKLWDIRIPLPFAPSLIFQLFKINPDVILSEGSSSLINASIAFLFAKVLKKKFIWWSLGKLEGKRYSGLRRIVNQWENYIEDKCDAIFTYSTKGKMYFRDRVSNPAKIFVGVNVLNTEGKLDEIRMYQGSSEEKLKEFNVAFIGTLTPEKNLEILISAVEIFNKKYNNIAMLHVIGDGKHLPVLRRFVKDIKMTQCLTFYGQVNKGASRILNGCDVMVLPGLGGLAICEGMLNSLPIITGKADGTEYDLVDSTNGFLLESITEHSIFEKLEYLYLNPAVRREMGRQSYRRITSDFTFDKYYNAFHNTVKYVLK